MGSFSSSIPTWHGHGIRRDQLSLQPNFQGPTKCSCGQYAGWWQPSQVCFPWAEEPEAENTSTCRLWFCSSAQLQFRTELHSLSSLQLSGHWWLSLPVLTAYLQGFESVTVPQRCLLPFSGQKGCTAMKNSLVAKKAVTVSVSSELPVKGTLKPLQPPLSEAWDLLAYSRKDSTGWAFAAIWKLLL